MSVFETIGYAKQDDGVAVLTLNRPQARNAFNVQMRDEVFETLTAFRDDPEARALLVVGDGPAFCAGADLTEFGTTPSQTVARQVRFERDLWGLWLAISKPMVAAIHGYCIGSGIEISACCDIRIASEDAVFAMPEVRLGLIPAAGGTQLLPPLLGPGRALDLLLSGRRFTAGDALRYGLVSQVVTRAALERTASDLLQEVLSMPDNALQAAKRAVAEGADLALKEALALEQRLARTLSA